MIIFKSFKFKSVITFSTIALAATLSVLFIQPASGTGADQVDQFLDYEPQNNNSGMVTWVRKDLKTNLSAIFLFDGLDEIQLSTYGENYGPQINEKGWVVWGRAVQGETEFYDPAEPFSRVVYLFDGRETRRLSNSEGYHGNPTLNNRGQVVWNWWSDGQETKIFFFDGTKTVALATVSDTDGQLSGPRINDDGRIVWARNMGETAVATHNFEIFLYNGKETIQLSHSDYTDGAPQINDKGLVAWVGGGDRTSDIWLYDGTRTINLTDIETPQSGFVDSGLPQINSSGAMTWTQSSNYSAWKVILFDGNEIKELGPGLESQINDRGWVVWKSHDGNDYEIFLYDGNETIQLTDNDIDDESPQINMIGWNPQQYTGAQGLALAGGGLARSQGLENHGRTDDAKPRTFLIAPFVSTKISKTTTFKVKWGATDPSAMAWQAQKGTRSPVVLVGNSGIKSYTVYYRPSTSRKWRTWKKDVKATQAYFTGKAGVTYYFRVRAEDNAGNYGWSKVRKTVIPFNEGMSLIRQVGFRGYLKSSKSPFFLSSVRHSYTRGNVLVYKLYNTNGIGLITTKGTNRGKAKIYLDGRHVKTVDAYKSSIRPRQLIFYKGFKKKGTHWLKIENLGTPGRARFDVDAIVVGR